MNESELIEYLCRNRLVDENDFKVESLDGGISGDVAIVRTRNRAFVVKQALDKLKTKDDWRCDARRNLNEYLAIQFVGTFAPDSVPRLLYVDPEQNLFAMEYFGAGFSNWKQRLLSGEVNAAVARRMAELLAAIHNTTWQVVEAQRQFDTTNSFVALRIEPYLITTGRRHPQLRNIVEFEAARLTNTRIALVHGDFSAKNILISADRHVILDWEVAWFGDPAFDSAFLLNLLLLKSLYRREQFDEFVLLIETFRRTYESSLTHFDEELDQRITRLTLLLLLARIDGKSPAEYFNDEIQRAFVRTFATRILLNGVVTFDELIQEWQSEVFSKC